jgi:hypothetical protein
MLISLFMLPMKLNLVPSNGAPGWPSSGSSAVPRPIVPNALPSFGAAGGVEPVGETQARRALHVLRHHGRAAGQMGADVPREQPGIEVVAAADRVAGIGVDGPALEIRRVLLRGRCNRRDGEQSGGAANGQSLAHPRFLHRKA